MPDVSSFMDSLGARAQLPPVNAEDLKRVREFLRTVRAKTPMAPGVSYQAGKPGQPAGGVDGDLIAEHCSVGANVEAVFFRHAIMQMLARQGLLAPWQHGEEIEDFVFQVFATYPFHLGSSETKLDVEALLQHIRDARANP